MLQNVITTGNNRGAALASKSLNPIWIWPSMSNE
jgi:hypothetical protein